MSPLLTALVSVGVALACVVATMTLTALRARQLGVVAVVDVAWGLGFVVVAVASTVVAYAAGADSWRTLLLLALVAVWGGRLAWHVRSRAVGEHGGAEDPRYAEMLGGSLPEVGMAETVRRVFLVQGVAQWFVSLPVAVGAVLLVEPGWAWLVWVGVAVWAVGLVFEAAGDRQLAAYKSRPRESRPKVMDQGLWGWTRHPNYFGDACVWWGLWLAGGLASGWVPGLVTLLCPVAMTLFLRNVTGAKLLEKKMSQREGWDEYAARVPMFFPRPPRR
jgi:steroid 5-alpha reductase family enzyme